MPEQLAFQNVFGKSRAMHLDDRIIFSRGEIVQGIRDELLAHPAFTGYQYGRPGRCDPFYHVEEFEH